MLVVTVDVVVDGIYTDGFIYVLFDNIGIVVDDVDVDDVDDDDGLHIDGDTVVVVDGVVDGVVDVLVVVVIFILDNGYVIIGAIDDVLDNLDVFDIFCDVIIGLFINGDTTTPLLVFDTLDILPLIVLDILVLDVDILVLDVDVGGFQKLVPDIVVGIVGIDVGIDVFVIIVG